MRKKILAAVLVATMPEVIGSGNKKLGNKIGDSSKKTEEFKIEEAKIEEVKIEEAKTEEVKLEEAKSAEVVAEEIITEEIVVEENPTQEIIIKEIPIKEIINEKIIIEDKSKYTYDFEGRYWLRYSEYGHKGLYFDGSKAINKMENRETFNRDYYVEDDLINIGGEYYMYEILDGKLGLGLARDELGGFSYYDEVGKAEYDSIFI